MRFGGWRFGRKCRKGYRDQRRDEVREEYAEEDHLRHELFINKHEAKIIAKQQEDERISKISSEEWIENETMPIASFKNVNVIGVRKCEE